MRHPTSSGHDGDASRVVSRSRIDAAAAAATPACARVVGVIDIDNESTWPSAVRDWAHRYAERVLGSARITSDLRIPTDEDKLRALLRGHKLLAYHCTRLLDYEVAAVREHGLRMLSEELVHERLDNAHARGFLTDDQHEYLRAVNVFARGEAKEREGRLWFVLGRDGLTDSGCLPLLLSWGGEGIYFGAPELEVELARIGMPTIVTAGIDLGVSRRVSPSYSGLDTLFVGKLLSTERCYSDVMLRAAAPPEDIIGLWQPGDAEYDDIGDLPRA